MCFRTTKTITSSCNDKLKMVFRNRFILITFLIPFCDITQAKGLCQFAEMYPLQGVESCFSSSTELDPVCPPNTFIIQCGCQKTCQDPTGFRYCLSNCTNGKTCGCPSGSYFQGKECVTIENCDCYLEEEGIVQEGTFIANCTRNCTCINAKLFCQNHSCDGYAVCEKRNSRPQCYCREGFHGNGINCSRSIDCKILYDAELTEDGVYTVYPLEWPGSPFDVYCREGWTIIQRRQDGSVDFYRGWTSYKEGFGNVEGDFWLGNDKLFYLTNQNTNQLRINVTFKDNSSYWLSYDAFGIGDENSYYILGLGTFTGNTGFDYMDFHRSQLFSTFDRDNDKHGGQNCAVRHYGAWWFRNCYRFHPNGMYDENGETGICFVNTNDDSWKCNVSFTEMSIKPVENQN